MLIDLQLFAEEPEEEPRIVEEPEEPEEPEEEPEEPEEEPDSEPEPAHDSVPLAKYMEEKKRRQEAEKVLAQKETEKQRYALKQSLMERGWPEPEAEIQAREQAERDALLKNLQRKTYEMDVRNLAQSNEFFADAEAFKSEILEQMERLDIGAKEAYMMLRGDVRTREMLTKQQQRAATKKPAKKVENASPTPVKSQYPLTAEERKVLAELQRAQPGAGWTAEKYTKLMKQKE